MRLDAGAENHRLGMGFCLEMTADCHPQNAMKEPAFFTVDYGK
jgi:hypothetical protein